MKTAIRIINLLTIILLANFPFLHEWTNLGTGTFVFLTITFILINFFPNIARLKIFHNRLRILAGGNELLVLFGYSTLTNVVMGLILLLNTDYEANVYLLDILTIFVAETVIFWNGIIRIYITSEQLMLKWRLISACLGWVPVLHLWILRKLLKITHDEVEFEYRKYQLNLSRREKKLCRTKYPILLVHGVFFRDYKYLNYWGRIPEELERNGATIFYGNQQSASSVENCGRELADKIMQIVNDSECGKVNIIAHSKGGLDSRFALTLPGIRERVASLTTINTPHRGCKFADYLLKTMHQSQINLIANTYNKALRKLGDHEPDFLKAVKDLTFENCKKFNDEIHDQPGVYYQSVGSLMSRSEGGQFPLNLSYLIARKHDGRNDGLVGEDSFPWGNDFQMITTTEKRGISHGDVIDLNHENLKDFDVREFYVDLVNKLKKRGL